MRRIIWGIFFVFFCLNTGGCLEPELETGLNAEETRFRVQFSLYADEDIGLYGIIGDEFAYDELPEADGYNGLQKLDKKIS